MHFFFPRNIVLRLKTFCKHKRVENHCYYMYYVRARSDARVTFEGGLELYVGTNGNGVL